MLQLLELGGGLNALENVGRKGDATGIENREDGVGLAFRAASPSASSMTSEYSTRRSSSSSAVARSATSAIFTPPRPLSQDGEDGKLRVSFRLLEVGNDRYALGADDPRDELAAGTRDNGLQCPLCDGGRWGDDEQATGALEACASAAAQS